MSTAPTLQGWSATLSDDVSRAEAIERAFDYRGDVTLVCTNGRQITGYLYNRNSDVVEPFAQLYDTTGASHAVRYADIDSIVFTGADMAAGKSYEAWLERRRQPCPAADETRSPPSVDHHDGSEAPP